MVYHGYTLSKAELEDYNCSRFNYIFESDSGMKKINEWLSIKLVKNPGSLIIGAILLFNIVFFMVSALVIKNLSLSGTEQMGFFEAVFCTITMILDAGCIQFVIADIGQSGVAVALTCLIIIIVGMISFTGAVIGYITNYISSFIEQSNSGNRPLHISGHIVILNWNTRASEIINDLLYCESYEKVVVLAANGKSRITKEIEERLSDTISRENQEIVDRYSLLPFFARTKLYRKERLRQNISVIVREGDVYSSKQLNDISIKRAKTVIILGEDLSYSLCKYENKERLERFDQGNSQTVKTLMQVADLTASNDSDDNQRIIVEITDDWTASLVDRIIRYKQVDGKCNIIPVRINQILGQILAQFSLMPELNLVYRELFSNKGAAFFTEPYTIKEDIDFVSSYLSNHKHAIPLTHMGTDGVSYHYFSAASESDVHTESVITSSDYSVRLNRDYWIENKSVIILGHNSKCRDIMRGFEAFRGEWQREGYDEIVKIVIIDDEESLKRMDYYREYPFVIDTVAANIYDKELICNTIDRYVSMNQEDTSILILSDDASPSEEIDAHALANLVYVQDIVNTKKEENPDFDIESIDIIVEIIDPKHYDVVNSYSVNNVVISNRYISKMITQIGEKEAIFDFYMDILTYDEDISCGYQSKEIYAKKVNSFFEVIPSKCTAEELIRALYSASTDGSLPEEKNNPAVALGYVKPGGKLVLFSGDQSAIEVSLDSSDKLIVFSNH